jgi:hypothetical protein
LCVAESVRFWFPASANAVWPRSILDRLPAAIF